MIDPDRVTQMAYLPGERVRAELGFNWNGNLTAVTAHFRKFVGSRYSARHLGEQISLSGKETRRVAEGDEVYTSVELEGVIPGSIDPGITTASSCTFTSRDAVGFWCSRTFISA